MNPTWNKSSATNNSKSVSLTKNILNKVFRALERVGRAIPVLNYDRVNLNFLKQAAGTIQLNYGLIGRNKQ